MAGINETINSFVDTTDRLVQDGLTKWDRFSEERKLKTENAALQKEIDAICAKAGEAAYQEFKAGGSVSVSLLEESFGKAKEKEAQIEGNLQRIGQLREEARLEAEQRAREKEESRQKKAQEPGESAEVKDEEGKAAENAATGSGEPAKPADFDRDNAEFWGNSASPYAKYQTGGKFYCPVCGGENYGGYLYCVKCGRALGALKDAKRED